MEDFFFLSQRSID